MICTFFGHREVPESVKDKLRETLIDLIENKNANMFYVGHQGKFDHMAASVLQELKKIYPQIDYRIVLAYLPKNDEDYFGQTEFPDGIENTPPKFAIDFRNKWMLNKADTVVAYITTAGAAQRNSPGRQNERKSR